MKRNFVLSGICLSFFCLFFLQTFGSVCQSQTCIRSKSNVSANYYITLKYYFEKKIQKQVVFASSSGVFSTVQKVFITGESFEKYLTLTFNGKISLLENINKDADFLLQYSITLGEKKKPSNGIQDVSGMRGFSSANQSNNAISNNNACSGIVKLKDNQPIVLYTLSRPLGSSKKKVETESEFEVSISKHDSRKNKR